jgi:hypothetical protein
MKNITLHIHIGERRTTVTLHPTLYGLISVKLTGELSARSTVSKWLGDQLTQQLGEHHPKNQGVSNLLSKYAVDVIASNLASPDLIKQYQDLMLGGDQ